MIYGELIYGFDDVLCVLCELLRADHRTLWDTACQVDWDGAAFRSFECLLTTGMISTEPFQLVMANTEALVKYLE